MLASNNSQQDAIRPSFDESKTYFPVFCLTEIPDEYFDEFDQHIEEHTPLIQVTSNDPDKVLTEIEAYYTGNKGPSPTPFLGCTIDQVYDFHKTSLRPADNSTAHEHFTYYTFIVVGAECVRSNPLQCILCCDAPDFGEADEEIKLKHVRMPIREAIQYLCTLEQLTMTPSEVENAGGWAVSMMPPPTMVRVKNEGPKQDSEETDAKDDPQREHITLREVPPEESLRVGIMARAAEQEARKRGYTIELGDNRTRKV